MILARRICAFPTCILDWLAFVLHITILSAVLKRLEIPLVRVGVGSFSEDKVSCSNMFYNQGSKRENTCDTDTKPSIFSATTSCLTFNLFQLTNIVSS